MNAAGSGLDQKKERSRIRRGDLLLLILILAVAGGWLLFRHLTSSPGLTAQVSVDGQMVLTLPLDEDGQFLIEGVNGGTNLLVVENGQIWCSEATCPDRLCVSQGKKSMADETIICLPNRMAVTLIAEN